MSVGHGYEECTVVPRVAITLPLPVPAPPGFEPARPETWPSVVGRLEFVQGGLRYMPPCGDKQQWTATDVARVLGDWQTAHPDFRVGSNEAGMLLGGEVRGADAAVWRRADLPLEPSGGFPRVAPVLAVEIAGKDEDVDDLRAKARWYLAHGVLVVWILDPAERSLLVMDEHGERRLSSTDGVPMHPALPDLAPKVSDLFRQLG